MPIYAYKCDACGHAKDVLQKMSDPLLTTCPACGKASFKKQLTAAGFQLKGSGWYVTDFRDGNKASGDKAASGSVAGQEKSADPSGAAQASMEKTPVVASPAASVTVATPPVTKATSAGDA